LIHYRGFWISLVLAVIAYAAGIPMARNAVAVFLPLALWVACFGNAWWRSRIVGWILFSVSFVSWMTVLGAFAMRWRLDPQIQVGLFARALVMYGALAMAGLYQLKGRDIPSPHEGEG
jgi:hypothetical protein